MSFYEGARVAFRAGDSAMVRRLSQRELDRARGTNDQAGEVAALGMLARVALRDDDLPSAQRLATQAHAVARRSGERRLEQMPTHILASLARLAGDLDGARVLFAESIALHELVGDAHMLVVEQQNMGYVELHSGQVQRARELFDAARQQIVRLEYQDMVPYATISSAVLAAIDGDHTGAARLLGAADGAFRAVGEVPDPDDAMERDELRDLLVNVLGQRTFDEWYAAGSTLDLRRALAG